MAAIGASSSSDSELTFVDYFVVAGLDRRTGLEIEKYAAAMEQNESRPPLEQSYVAKVIGHYPEKRPGRTFRPEILSLCMPKGLRFCTQKDLPSEPTFHTFANIREDGSRIDGCVLTFYEEVKDVELCQAMHSLHTQHVREITGTSGEDGGGRTQQQLIENGRQHVPPGTVSGGSHTLPRRGRKDRLKRTSYYDSGQDALYVSKCICLITRLPVVSACETVLRTIHRLIASSQPSPLPIESYVYWLLNEVPLPPAGSTLKVTLEKSDIIFQRPGPDELPFFDHSLRALFQLIPVDKVLKIYTCLLLEQQILLCSRALNRLMLVAESVTALAFPFRWQHVYVPILPYSQALFLEAPVPFIMGLCYDEAIPEQVFQSNVCVLDIDTGRLELPEDLPVLPERAELVAELELAMQKVADAAESEASQASHQARLNRGRTSRRDDWSVKRMSRSFDEDGVGLTLAAGAEDPVVHSPPSRGNLTPLPLEVLKESESLARVRAIARKAGVNVAFDTIQQELDTSDTYKNSPSCRRYFQDMKFNNAVREIFLNRFTCLLYSYDHFVIGGGGAYPDRDTYFANRDSMANFDKASFLSDQPDSHLSFLAAFLETQMFTSFIDCKVLAQWEEADPNLDLFDRRIQEQRDRFGLAIVRTPTYESCPSLMITEEIIAKREDALDYIVPPPHMLDGIDADEVADRHEVGVFPDLNGDILGRALLPSPQRSPWKQRHRILRPTEEADRHLVSGGSRPSTYGGSGLADTPAQIAHTNWKFVEQLLRETKAKTKRMLVEKMGREAVQLGHGDVNITGVEENTLVASFCDLLERIWAHGQNKKMGKSALWAHLLHHQDMEKGGEHAKAIHGSPFLTPAEDRSPVDEEANGSKHAVVSYLQGLQKDMGAENAPWSSSILRAASFLCDKIDRIGQNANTVFPTSGSVSNLSLLGGGGGGGGASASSNNPRSRFQRGTLHKANSIGDFAPTWTGGAPQDFAAASAPDNNSPRKRSLSRPRSPDIRQNLPPLPTHIAYDLKNVLRMSEIKTDIGYARAFVRLALERKLLHKHLKTLLLHSDLLRELYKRYAFLRCEDEKEQFLYHILSLNAAEFRCFTNTFTRTKMQYQVLLVPGNSRFASTSATIWVLLAGSLGQTVAITLPKSTLQFAFDHKNLGVLSTLRIGHDLSATQNAANSAQSSAPKWFLDFVLVRNEITGQTYRFSCGRWFGRGVDDGSLERLLVAEVLSSSEVERLEAGISGGGGGGGGGGHSRSRTPPRARSPSASRSESASGKPRTRVSEVQHQLGDAVNCIVKHFYRSVEKDQRSQLTQLLCGERGLVVCLEQAFLVGFRSSRFFRQQYPWDYIEKVNSWFIELFRCGEGDQLAKEQKVLIRHGCLLVGKIAANSSMGKEGKFQAFILITVRDHILSGLLPLLAWTPITSQLYDEPSFLRTPQYLTFLTRLLNSLNEFNFDLEKSLTYGVDV
uniref:DENN domain-containing protein 5A n=1 Tax=Plectus sambesii TaxID=2011161 RepID=A0A914XD19_9BILA